MAAMVRLINRNMRCIEMCIWLKVSYREIMINRNMRCIEIGLQRPSEQAIRRLIETWDVLKYWCHTLCIWIQIWLIETWDVLKSPLPARIITPVMPINRNMRCIEI